MTKKKIEIEIKDESGNVTFYHQMVTSDTKQIKIPLGKIHQQLKKGKKDPDSTVH
jgi:hypothetical protein